MDKFDDFLKYSILFSYYKELFSTKQKQYLSSYLEENNSLTEIAELFFISRQAVFDNIKRGFKQLEIYEKKLGMFQRDVELKKKLEQLKKNFCVEKLNQIICELDYDEVL